MLDATVHFRFIYIDTRRSRYAGGNLLFIVTSTAWVLLHTFSEPFTLSSNRKVDQFDNIGHENTILKEQF